MQHVEYKRDKAPQIDPSLTGYKRIWNQFRYWRYNATYDFYDRIRRHVTIIAAVIVAMSVGLIIYDHVAPRPSGVKSTPLNQAQPFGTLGKAATLTKKVYDPNNKNLYMYFRLGSQDPSDSIAVDTKFIQAKYDGNFVAAGRTDMEVIPTSKNSFVVRTLHLSNNWRDVQVILSDKQVDPNTVQTPSASSDSSDKNMKNEQVATFIANSDKLKQQPNLGTLNQKELAIIQNKMDIDAQTNLIKSNQSAIKKLQKSISQQQQNITYQQSHLSGLTGDELTQAQSKIEGETESLTSVMSKVSTANENIANARTKIKSLRLTGKQIESGSYKLQKPYALQPKN